MNGIMSEKSGDRLARDSNSRIKCSREIELKAFEISTFRMEVDEAE